MATTTFFWDFFGPRAAGTAEHFQRHLEELLLREQLVGCVTGCDELAGGHWVVSCRAPPAAVEPLRRALRPKRQREEP